MAPHLILIRGLPGSGKSTLARQLAAQGYEHFEADQYFETPQGYEFRASELPAAHARCLMNAVFALGGGNNVVVANTFTTRAEMEPYFYMAASLGITVEVREASGNWPSIHGVPEQAIQRMRARWEEFDETAE